MQEAECFSTIALDSFFRGIISGYPRRIKEDSDIDICVYYDGDDAPEKRNPGRDSED